MFDARQYLYTISAKRKRFFTELTAREGLRQMEVEILLFLHDNPDSNTLTEIMHANDYTKSHVSTSISSLVDKGFISKTVSPTNKKIHNLTLLSKSEQVIKEILACIQSFHDKAMVGVTEAEIDEMTRILTKINDNLKDGK